MNMIRATVRDPQPRGVYDAVVQKIEERTSDAFGGSYLHWTWTARNRAGEEVPFTATSSTNFGPQAKARKWVHALLGNELTKAEARTGVDLDQLIGLPCKLVIGIVERESGTFNSVESVLPADD